MRSSRIVVGAYSVLGGFVTIKPADGRGEPGIGHHSVTDSDLTLDTPTDR